ncbi:MAG: hypothetical protein NW206_06630 [Hyphomonadaceae bacterium]|nr:hypothetical protein [Hyphomonadaceae bacterium]
MKLTRRTLMLSGAAVGAVGVGVGVYGLTGTPYDYFKEMLHFYLPGVTIPDETIRAFTVDAMDGRNTDFAPKLKALTAGVRVTGFYPLQLALGGTFAFEKFNRELLSYFLLSSNFFDVPDPRAAIIEYAPISGACLNRFAEFSPPS